MTLNQPGTPISILIVDDHKLSNECLKLGLEKEPDIHILGQAFDGFSAVEMAKSLNPDMILMDVCMPNQNGIQATGAIKRLMPKTKIVMTTSMMDKKVVQAAFAANADGYCTKETQLGQLVQMIRAVSRGAVCVDPKVALYAVREIAGVRDVDAAGGFFQNGKPVVPMPSEPKAAEPKHPTGAYKPDTAVSTHVFSESSFTNAAAKENASIEKPKPMMSIPPFAPVDQKTEQRQEWQEVDKGLISPIQGKIEDQLTQRELEILMLIADNNSDEAIAQKTGLSPAWLTNHIKNILVKLSVSNEIQAIQRALHEGLIEDAPLLYQD